MFREYNEFNVLKPIEHVHHKDLIFMRLQKQEKIVSMTCVISQTYTGVKIASDNFGQI